MPAFNSDYERRKWESLQNSAGASLTAIAHGRATQADTQKVLTVLNAMNAMAANLFARSISAAEVQAKKFEAEYQQVRVDQAIDTLTSFEMALNAALKPMVPEILSGIKESFALELMQANEELDEKIGGRFEHLRELLPPKDLPTVNDLLAAQELLAEDIQRYDEMTWPRREASLVEKVVEKFRDTLRDVADAINRERAARAGQHLLAGPHGVIESPIMSKVSGLLGSSSAVSGPIGASTGVGAITTVGSGALVSGAPAGGAQITLPHSTQQVIEKAASDQTNLYDKLYQFLTGQGEGGQGSVQNTLSEEEKADVWWRSFRNWVGDTGIRKSKKREDDGGIPWLKWLKGLRPLIAAMVLDPQLFKEMGALVQKYVTWDNIRNVFTAAVNDVADEGKKMIDWVVDALHLKEAGDWIRKKLGIEGPHKGDTAPREEPPKPTPPGTDPFAGAPPGAAAGIALPVPVGTPNARSSNGKSPDAKDPYTIKMMRSLGLSVGGDTMNQSINLNNRSTLISPTGISGMGGTFSVPDMAATMKPGVTVKNPDTIIPEQSEFSMPGAARGTTQVGINSFGFQAAMSDSLLMMNSHYFTS